MTKGEAFMNAAYCMDTVEEEEGCVDVIQCNRIDDATDVWRTS
jgi:hypothetical protein